MVVTGEFDFEAEMDSRTDPVRLRRAQGVRADAERGAQRGGSDAVPSGHAMDATILAVNAGDGA